MRFLIVNGKITENTEVNLNLIYSAISFRLSQKIWYGFGDIPFFFENMELLEKQSAALKIPFPEEYHNKRELFRLVKRMLNKNKLYRSGHVHLQIFWSSNTVQTLVTCHTFPGFDFPVSAEGLLACFSNQKKLSLNTFNRFAFFNEILWEACFAEIRNSLNQQVIILNEKDNVCESACANIFMISGNELITPSPESGCYEDILRPVIPKLAVRLGLNVSEIESITKNRLLQMDEVFIASEQLGIQWIAGIGEKRFIHHYSEKIYGKLNELLKVKSNS